MRVTANQENITTLEFKLRNFLEKRELIKLVKRWNQLLQQIITHLTFINYWSKMNFTWWPQLTHSQIFYIILTFWSNLVFYFLLIDLSIFYFLLIDLSIFYSLLVNLSIFYSLLVNLSIFYSLLVNLSIFYSLLVDLSIFYSLLVYIYILLPPSRSIYNSTPS